MNSAFRRTGAFVCSVAALVSAPALWATQPSPIDVTVEARYARRGPSFLHLVNQSREPYRMTFMPGPAATLRFTNQTITIAPGAAMDLNLGQLAFVDGINVFDAASQVILVPAVRPNAADGSVIPGPGLHEVLAVNSDTVRTTTYAEAFLSKRLPVRGESRPDRIPLGGGVYADAVVAQMAFPSQKLDGKPRFTPVDLPSPLVLSNMKLKQLPDFAKAGARGGGDDDSRGDDDNGGDLVRTKPNAAHEDSAKAPKLGKDGVSGPFGGIQGSIFLKVPSGNSVAFDPAWGWNVRAWNLIGGQWLLVGSTFAAGDGTWTINYPLPLFSNTVRVEYVAANRFLQLQDENSNIYTWGDNWQVNKVTDLGFRAIDLTLTGDAPGIDRIFTSAVALWHAFWLDNMNALRDQPIQITYPNTSTSNCSVVNGNGVTVPWSCSQSSDGKIWLISKHARAGVVQHEIAHSIHSYYWGGFPSGSGGQHKLTGCYNPGLALTEGFADFMPYWVQFNRNTAAPVEPFLNYNIETPGNTFCTGASNEVWVSATFWDVHDTHNDGALPLKDDWNFTHHGAAVGTFLNNPGNGSMQNYWLVYQIILGPAWTTRIFDTFLLNTIF